MLKAEIQPHGKRWYWVLRLKSKSLVTSKYFSDKELCIKELQLIVGSIREGDVPLFEGRNQIASDVNAYGD